MTSKKWQRLFKKALKTLGLAVDDNTAIKSTKDLNALIKDNEMEKVKMEDLIQRCNEIIEQADRNINNLIALKNQIEIEEYKEMNPNAKAIYKF